MFHLEAVLSDETLSAGFLARYRYGSLTLLAWNCLMLHEKLSFVLGLQALNITIPDKIVRPYIHTYIWMTKPKLLLLLILFV